MTMLGGLVVILPVALIVFQEVKVSITAIYQPL